MLAPEYDSEIEQKRNKEPKWRNLTNCEVANRFRCSRGKKSDVLKLSKMSLLPFLR